MQEIGLIGEWLDRYQHKPKQCFNLDKGRQKEEIRNPHPINLKNVIGTFQILGIGFGISFSIFALEIIWSRFKIATNRFSRFIFSLIRSRDMSD